MSADLFAYLWTQAKRDPRIATYYTFHRIQKHHTIVWGHRNVVHIPEMPLVLWAIEDGNREMLLRAAALSLHAFKRLLLALRRRRAKCASCRGRLSTDPRVSLYDEDVLMELKHAACQRVIGCVSCCTRKLCEYLCLHASVIESVYTLVRN